MEKNTQSLVAIFALLALLVGFTLGAVLMGEDTVTIKENVVEKIINVSVDRIVEVPADSQLDKAVAEFMKAVEDEKDEAGNAINVVGTYDFDEIEVSRIYDDYSVTYEDDTTTVNFSIKLRFDEYGEASEKATFNVTVIFELDEDTEVIVA